MDNSSWVMRGPATWPTAGTFTSSERKRWDCLRTAARLVVVGGVGLGAGWWKSLAAGHVDAVAVAPIWPLIRASRGLEAGSLVKTQQSVRG